MMRYAEKVGIQINNIYAVLSGQRQCTLDWLNKLLSGIGHEVVCTQEFVIQPFEIGQNAAIAFYTELDEESLYEETRNIEAESMSSSSEKLQDKSKMPLESPLQDQVEKS